MMCKKHICYSQEFTPCLTSECVFLPEGLTLRLNGKKIIPNNGEVVITDLLVGGCRRYDSLECLSDVPYRGRMEKAYWKYTDTHTLKDLRVDDIRCNTSITGRCKNPEIGWQSSKGIYRNKIDNKYYGVVRLGKTKDDAELGHFTCYFEGDSDDKQVSVNIVEREDMIVTLILGFIS